ncbi:hypothetical protein CPB86DRAFT_783661 [Serendipita vermifera]|nr:hypothetical protein CPB86DRAFT_783661 [Serendipita vermifera]
MSFLVVISSLLITLVSALVVSRRWLYTRNEKQRNKFLSTKGTISIQEHSRHRDDVPIVGFLHPYCNAGGGGERVLWVAIAYLQRTESNVLPVVYTGDVDDKTRQPIAKEAILERVQTRFGISLDANKIEFVHLKWRWLIEDSTWKRFTLLGQGIGAALLGAEAMWRLIPDVFIDTMGLAFSYPVVRFLTSGVSPRIGASKIPIVAYIHYPTVSASMLQRVASRETTYANDATVTGSGWRSSAKLLYYRLFSFLYTSCLLTSPPVHLAVNSSWTKAHVEALLETQSSMLTSASTKSQSIPYLLRSLFSLATILLGLNPLKPRRINEPPSTQPMEKSSASSISYVRKIYPPCDIESMQDFKLQERKRVIFSCAQFRPEKDHAKQIEALSILFKTHPELIGADERLSPSSRISNLLPESPEDGLGQSGWLDVSSSSETVKRKPEKEGVSLVLLGSARHQDDLARVEELKELAAKLGVQSHVHFRLNATYEELLHWLSVSSIGISTMVEEHFGIGVVEFMGAGLIPVVHASGGPIMDIVTPLNGKPTGFLATAAEEFASQLYAALSLSQTESVAMRDRARRKSREFSTEEFEKEFRALWEAIQKS